MHGKTFGDTKIEVALTLTNKSDAPGIQKARNFGLESVILEHTKFASREEFDRALVVKIKEADVDLVVLAGFMRILTPYFCKNVRAINLHPSLLPLFKGARAIDESFQSDMQVGGVSVHFVSAELDGGKIIAQKAFARKDKTREEWEEKIHEIEHKILPKTIKKLLVKNQIFCKNSDD